MNKYFAIFVSLILLLIAYQTFMLRSEVDDLQRYLDVYIPFIERIFYNTN